MSRILVTYASTHGHTAKIAARIADVLRADGHTADLRDDLPDVDGYDAEIAGGSVHGGMHRGDHPSDTRRDYDFTDWDAVEAFARESALLAEPARAGC